MFAAVPADVNALSAIVLHQLPGADELTLRLVTATVGLLAGVAYADRDYSAAEQEMVRDKLLGIDAFARKDAAAICKVLADHASVEVAGRDPDVWTRELNAVTDKWQRRQVLDVLVDVAAADGVLTNDEDTFLARVSGVMELGAGDYAESLGRHPALRRG
jgi:uncharacterized tellurite resistance protein B-like protein